MQTLFNGVEVFTNGDNYNLADDVAHAFETGNMIIQVGSLAQRDGLAALAPGGVLPVPTFIYRTDLNRREMWNGTEWLGDVRHAEISYASASVPNNLAWGPGIGTINTARSLYSSFATTPENDYIEVSHAGVYSISWYMVVGGATATPVFCAINRGAERIFGQQYAAGFETSPSVPNIHMNAGERFKLIMVQTSGSARDISHKVRVTRVG